MSVDVGSGTAESDLAVLAGTESGQGNYVVRLGDGVTNVPLDASDVSNPRIDEIYVVVQDHQYDSSNRVLPRIGYRKGDAAASPSAPGPDGAWTAYLLVATVAVGAGETTIEDADITDERVGAAVQSAGEVDLDTLTNTGTTITITATSTEATVFSGTYTPPAHWGTYELKALTYIHARNPSSQRLAIRTRIDGVLGSRVNPTATSFNTGYGMTVGQVLSGLTGAVLVEARAATNGGTMEALCTSIDLIAKRLT
jgi:hypothetical protein